ncbi:hypothetical protein QJQ45_009127 [Haematococcus lacustris]|nr:hypothetical protein QJQ45_009127 [Haematococcus lacustris]
MANLNNLHLHLSNGQPAMDAPAFRVDNVTEVSCHLHYYSNRPALWPIVVGVLKGLSKQYLKYDLTVELLQSRDDGHDHEVFLVGYPRQTLSNRVNNCGDSQPEAAAAVSPCAFTLSPDLFAELHPFHLLLDCNCSVLQFGSVLPRLVPGIAVGAPAASLFKVRHPHTKLTWEGIAKEVASSFVLQVPSTGLELKGQMIPTHMPVPGCPVPKPVMLFMGSPRLANLDEMMRHKLYCSDIPLHDLSRDFVLLAEQRQAEADLKEKFEKLTVEIQAEKMRSDALVQRMSGLLACFPFKGEKAAGTVQQIRAVAQNKSRRMQGPAGPQAANVADHPVASDETSEDDDLNTSNSMSMTTMLHGGDESLGRMEVIEAVRRTLGSMNLKQSEQDTIELVQAIGEGSYGKVYKALWQGSEVAVKTIMLPATMSGSQKREKMAIMEAAISSSLSHPNIVQTYTYTIQPLRETAESKLQRINEQTPCQPNASSLTDSASKGAITSYEVKLVLELCDSGSLRDALEQGAFILPDATLNYAAVLDTAADLAKACIHMHRHGVLHSDIKARNVLLRGSGGSVGRGVTAKIADFGLAVKLPPGESCINNLFQGTITHMAPEVLKDGCISKQSDVYAFGITLWELFTGGHAFKGVPKSLLGHQVINENRRPEFPPGTPVRYKQLAEWCWNKDVNIRPTFEEILALLLSIRREIEGSTAPLQPFLTPADQQAEEQARQAEQAHSAATAAPAGHADFVSHLTHDRPSGSHTATAAGIQREAATGDALGASVSFIPSDSDSGYSSDGRPTSSMPFASITSQSLPRQGHTQSVQATQVRPAMVAVGLSPRDELEKSLSYMPSDSEDDM